VEIRIDVVLFIGILKAVDCSEELKVKLFDVTGKVFVLLLLILFKFGVLLMLLGLYTGVLKRLGLLLLKLLFIGVL
jgi:hypothetical protein